MSSVAAAKVSPHGLICTRRTDRRDASRARRPSFACSVASDCRVPLLHAPRLNKIRQETSVFASRADGLSIVSVCTAAAPAATLTDNDKSCPIFHSPFTGRHCPALRQAALGYTLDPSGRGGNWESPAAHGVSAEESI
jgi:hypothetical protein